MATWRLCLLLWIFGVHGEGPGDACFAPASTKVLLQVAQNSSAGNSSTNESLKTDDATFETSSLSWSNFQVRLLMLAVMTLFFAACAAAWWFSFQHPDAFRLSLKDTMTYNALGLLSWIALVNAARTVWGNYTLWIMACRFLAVVLAIAVLEISLFSDPGSMNPLAFSEITNVLTVFVSLLLGFYLSSSIKRWTTCIDGFLSLFEVIRALQMQLHALGVARDSIAKVVRYGLLSAWLCARLQHIEGLDKPKRKAALFNTWQELRHSADPYLRLTPEECEKLEHIDDPCPILWLWVALFLGRLAADGDIPPMASPTYGRMVMLANDAQVALKEVRMCGEVKIPYLYTHTLSAVVHLNNILCAISMGLTLGACIGELLTIIDPRLTLYGEKSYPTSTASQVGQILMVQALKCFCAPLLYQACLEICFCLYSAFGGETDEATVPADRMVREWTKELDGLIDLAAKPPHWSAPVFKSAISHVPDIQRTKAQMMQSTKKGIRA